MNDPETIAAVATPAGRGGVSMVRISGAQVKVISNAILGDLPEPRMAMFRAFAGADGNALDHGIALHFAGPHSFTGEDVLELHGHGGAVVTDMVLQRVLSLGARLARPGEFSERAFLNGKLDLAQAEAIADVIDSQTQEAARSAMRSLQGEFSTEINSIVDDLTQLRVVVEAALDFPDEDIDVFSDEDVIRRLTDLRARLDGVLAKARQGNLLREGLNLVIVGRPNAGKSSLLNRLAREDAAIVTAIPGTTRDVLTRDIELDGLWLRAIDTAGLRASDDPIEQEGIRRARAQIDAADLVLLVIDDSVAEPETQPEIPSTARVLPVRNKIDLSGREAGGHGDAVCVSATTGAGFGALTQRIKTELGFNSDTQGVYIARRRHLLALEAALAAIDRTGADTLPEVIAEELRLAQRSLGEITGRISSDELLGQIFSSFCIGK